MTPRVLGEHQGLPQGDDKRRSVEAMFDRVAPRYERMNRVISLGLDRRWREHAVVALGLPRGSRVLDLACGTGDLCRDLQRSGYEPVGIDFSAGMLTAARTSAPLVRGDAACLPFSAGIRRCGLRVRAPELRRSRVGVRRVPRACCAEAVASPRSTPRSPRTRSSAPGTRSGSVARSRSSGACSRTMPTPTATSRSRPRTFPRRASSHDDSQAAASPTSPPRTSPAVPSCSLTGTRA